MFRWKFAAAALAVALSTAPAVAASFVTVDGTNSSVTLDESDPFDFTVLYNGYSDEIAGNIIAGLTTRIDFEFLGSPDDGLTYEFGYTMTNTSSSPITRSRVSVFGFDIDPDALVDDTLATGDFTFINDGNVPAGFGSVELCFKSAVNGGNCAGGANGGVLIGDTGTGTFSLKFASEESQIVLDRLFVRYQSIYGTTVDSNGNTVNFNDFSAIGYGVPTIPVPEPAAWAMMIAGFGMIGGALRARRRTSIVTA